MNELSQSKSVGDSSYPVDISIVIPIYNERENLEPLIAQINAAMALWQGSYEIIVVDDGSDDGSDQLLSLMANREPQLRPVFLVRR